jgi:hypothetical protein
MKRINEKSKKGRATYGRTLRRFSRVPGSVWSGTMTSHSNFGAVEVAIVRIDLAIAVGRSLRLSMSTFRIL